MDIVNSADLDDSRDHWTAAIHREEEKNFLDMLFQFNRQSVGSRTTVLVGDVHTGAYATIRNTAGVRLTDDSDSDEEVEREEAEAEYDENMAENDR